MGKAKEAFDKIPWASLGRATPFSKLAASIVPVGNHHFNLPQGDPNLSISRDHPEFEQFLMAIEGTAFQVGEGKLLTCWHVAQELDVQDGRAYLQANTRIGGVPAKRYYPVAAKFNFIDPRFDTSNEAIDVGMLICPAIDTPEYPYLVPKVDWGDSTRLGIGDRVLIAGFPLGRDMFIATQTNRGFVQPTFYDGVISAIIPALVRGESRLLQISTVALGGASGGVVCDARTAKVLGMVTSGLSDANGTSLPITYAVPSEVLRPWADSVSFEGTDGRTWR